MKQTRYATNLKSTKNDINASSITSYKTALYITLADADEHVLKPLIFYLEIEDVWFSLRLANVFYMSKHDNFENLFVTFMKKKSTQYFFKPRKGPLASSKFDIYMPLHNCHSPLMYANPESQRVLNEKNTWPWFRRIVKTLFSKYRSSSSFSPDQDKYASLSTYKFKRNIIPQRIRERHLTHPNLVILQIIDSSLVWQ